MKKTVLIISAILFAYSFSLAQIADTPLSEYVWKGGKTKLEKGYVILKSDKKLEGLISLKGSLSSITEVYFEGEDKKIKFPPSALKAYGLFRATSSNTLSSKRTSSEPVNDSPESMYEWMDRGVVMDKVITVSKPRDGYVVLKSGKKITGILKLKRKDDVLTNYEVKTLSKKKVKGDVSELVSYGYNVSEEAVAQENLNSLAKDFSQGTVKGQSGSIAQVNIQGKFYFKKIIFKTSSGKLQEYDAESLDSFTQVIEGKKTTFIAVEGTFVAQEFNGATFKLYRNPFPTTINNFATGLAKTGAEVATTAIAQAAVNKDAKDNNYVTNMDSVIAVSTKEELIQIRDRLVRIGGYSNTEELQERSNNESLKTTVEAIGFAIAGKEIAESEGGILNKEWVILNKQSGEKTIVYKSDYKKLIEPLLKGCYEYLSLAKSEQKSYEKWNALQKTVKLLDGCY